MKKQGQRIDRRAGRTWIKVQLKSDGDAKHAGEIVEYWRQFRQAALHVTRAIRMYYALTQGDTSLLREYFPLIVDSFRAGAPIRPSALDVGALGTTAPLAPPKVERRAKSADEDKADLLDLF